MLKKLRSIIYEVSTAKNLRDALDTLVLQIQEVTHAEACSIFLLDEQKNQYILMATEGLNKKLIGKLSIKLGEGLIGLVGEREEPMNIADTFAHPKFCHYDEASKQPFQAFLGIPIIHQKELLGVLSAQKQDPHSFDETEEAFLVTITAQLANVLALAKSSGDLEKITKVRAAKVVDGKSCSSGIGIGKTIVIYPTADLEAIPDKKIDDPKPELAAFKKALKEARKEIINLEKSLPESVGEAERALFDAYLQIIDSPSLKKDINKEIRSGNWANGALKHVINNRIAQFAAMDDEYLRERSLDIKDLGQRILAHLQKKPSEDIKYPKQTILVGEEIPPATLAEVPENQLAGIISLSGSVNSHVAILARAMNIPAVMGIKDISLTSFENKKVIIDGYYGQVYLAPNKKVQQEFSDLINQEHELDAELAEIRNLPTQTTDGYKISLLVNTGLPIDIGQALRVETEGVGLYRTEVPFMSRDRFPSEEEQRVIYRQLLQIFAPRPVIMRTLDIGGDKNLPYFPIKEQNPFLGWRGIRVTLDHPEIFLVQIRAMLRASEGLNNLRIMLPMISSISEVEHSLKLIKQAHKELTEEGLNIQMPLIGIMIEVPSAVYLAQDLAARVDFVSVGSNDLTQYLLAVDRTNERVANLYETLHPAVLKALAQIVLSAHREHKEVSICGELAGDPVAVLLLLAMGFDALSMNANQILKIKWLIRNISMEKAQQLYEEITAMDDPTEIRYHMESALEEAGVAGLIRAGK